MRRIHLSIATAVVLVVVGLLFVTSTTASTRRHTVAHPASMTQPTSSAHPATTAHPSATDQPAAAGQPAATGADDSIPHAVPFRFRLRPAGTIPVIPDAEDYASRTTATGPLLLFLPATGHVPDDYTIFLSVASHEGYHVLGLDFWNLGKAVARTCGTDPSCYTELQRNRFSGVRPNRFSKVDSANSVLARLTDALTYLQQRDPSGGWNQYEHDGVVNWSKIVVSGHSQGGGEAAYIAHTHACQGQLTFSSPIITDKDIAASWTKTPSATPVSRMYAFDDEHDFFYNRILPSWNDIGLGTPLRAAVPVPASAGTHALISTLTIGDPNESHLRSVDDETPIGRNGRPEFEPVWTWMLRQVHSPVGSNAGDSTPGPAPVKAGKV